MPTDYFAEEDVMETQDKMQLEIDKRKEKNDKAVMSILRTLFQKPYENLTEDDKGFIRARQTYLTKAQRDEYADIINPKVDLMSYSRSQLDDMARELGIDTEGMKNKQEVVSAIESAKAGK